MSREFLADEWVEKVVANLSLKEKIALLSGKRWWFTSPIDRYGGLNVPAAKMSDGPNGVRGKSAWRPVPASCFPCSTGLGASFDIELAQLVGEALASECRQKNVHILLAPTVNTQRSPLGGRGFESFSEDPLLNGKIAASYIKGLQENNKNPVAAVIKHFVANDQEYGRFSISSEVSDRALREIYLKPFQIAIKEAEPWALMTSQNRVNGTFASDDLLLLQDVLRKEWGFKGTVISDWGGIHSVVQSIKAGVDIELPGPSVFRGDAIQDALQCGDLTQQDIDDRARGVLSLVKHAIDSKIPFNQTEEGEPDPDRVLLRRTSTSSIVLLKNEEVNGHKLLPIQFEKLKGRTRTRDERAKVAVIGPNADQARFSGGGSASLQPSYTRTPLQGINDIISTHGWNADVYYTPGVNAEKYRPLIDSLIRLPDNSDVGGQFRFWKGKPSKTFLDLNVDWNESLSEDVFWAPTASSSLVHFTDDFPDGAEQNCWICYTTVFTPDVSGVWQFGFAVVGVGNLFIDRQLIVDLTTDAPSGNSFCGGGTIERVGTLEVVEGNQYQLEVRMRNKQSDYAITNFGRQYALRRYNNSATTLDKGAPFVAGGLRIGGGPTSPATQDSSNFRLVEDTSIEVVLPKENLRIELEDIRVVDVPLVQSAAIEAAVTLAEDADVVIVVIGLNSDYESQGFDRDDVRLPGQTNELVSAVLAANKSTIIVNQSGTPVEMPWVDSAHAILQAFYGGNSVGEGLADILFGVVNPSAKLPLTFPKYLENNPSHPNYGPNSNVQGKVFYQEDIFVGYRGYEKKKIVPLFPFGHGLSYTTFEYSDLQVGPWDTVTRTFNLSFKVQNTGSEAGEEVVQVYVAGPAGSIPRPVKELVDFKKVKLKAGAVTEMITRTLDVSALSYWDTGSGVWVVEAGDYVVHIAASSEDIRASKSIRLPSTIVWKESQGQRIYI